MHSLLRALGDGTPAQELGVWQVAARALILFFAALIVVRIANKRFFAKNTAFDLILSLILASMMARAINGSERLVPTITAGLVLAILHRLLAAAAFRWPRFGDWIKGSSETLIKNGEMDRATMSRHNFAEDDLLEELRLNGVKEIEKVEIARLERSGNVSVIKK